MKLTGKEFVESFIKSESICIIAKSYCPYCKKVIEELSSAGYSPKVEQIDQREDSDEIQNYCEKISGSRSVPRVFVHGKCIGGCDATLKMLQEGTFKELYNE